MWKPPPVYDPEALPKHFNGKVVLEVIFSSSGEVSSITAVKELSYHLTERAIEAAKLIRFIPAEKDGRLVSQRATIVYPFLRN
jgi:hypothetical protein